jgi:hypothetical protein
MATDFSRVRHDPLLDWSGVQLKQGGVLLDADANELVSILDRRLRALSSDVLGRATVSATTPDAFRITSVSGDLEIGRGRMYVDGLLAENHGGDKDDFDPLLAEPRRSGALRYTAQLPSPPALPTSGRFLVYLDVWQREVTPLEFPALVESAIGVDTSSRMQTVWQVRLKEVGTDATCGTPDGELAGWDALTAPSEGRLTTGEYEVPPIDDPCELPPTGGYRGLENQLYRVEIHDGGVPGTATFKWSRENASVGARVSDVVSATELELETLGRDDVLGFADGDWVEIIDDAYEFARKPGAMRRITIPDPGNRRIELSIALPSDMVPGPAPDGPQRRNLRVRRWDQKGSVFSVKTDGTTAAVQDLDATPLTGVITVPADATTPLLLEHGVTVSFASVGTRGFKTGDWWVFAARTADASVESLVAAPPRGIHHHFARLGILDAGDRTVTDCRHSWPPEGGEDCACTQCVSPESHNNGKFTLQAAVDRLQDTGGTICLQPGTYVLREPVRIRGMRSIAIRGSGQATMLTAAGAAFLVEASAGVAIEQLAITSVGLQSAIDVRSVLGLKLHALAIIVYALRDRPGAAIALSGICADVRITDNALTAWEGIRTETPEAEPVVTTHVSAAAPRYTLLAAVAIERNALWCKRRGIAISGVVLQMWDIRIAGNHFRDCSDDGLLHATLSLAGSSLHIEDNHFSVQGHGIACSAGGTWIANNRLQGVAGENRETLRDGIALIPGIDLRGSEGQAHILANQVSGFTGTAIAIRAPVSELIVKMNLLTDCGGGIAMTEDAESDAVSIENNHLRRIEGAATDQDVPLTVGISVRDTVSATVAGNQLHDIARSRSWLAAVGILVFNVVRSRIAGNVIGNIGPVDEFDGFAAGIYVHAPMRQTEVCDNAVHRDGEGNPGETRWHALYIEDGLKRIGSSKLSAAIHSPYGTTVRLDALRSVVLSERRIRVTTDVADLAGAVATDVPTAAPAAAAGSLAIVTGNALHARGGVPAVVAHTTAELTFNNNRCELVDVGVNAAVHLDAPVLMVHGNRVRNRGEASILLLSGERGVVSAVGNITSMGIGPLAAPWAALNIIG